MELIGFIADSYTRHGGRRRIVDITSGARTVREFETYGCKVFASIKPIHYDIKDRCIMITMERSTGPYPTPIFEHPMWSEIRGKLYKALFIYGQAVFRAGQYYKTANRVEELLMPLSILWDFMELPEGERERLYKFLRENIEKNQFVMTDQEKAVFDVILEIFAEMKTNTVQVSPEKILQEANRKLINERIQNKAEVEGIVDKYCLASDVVVKKNSKGKYTRLMKFEKPVIEDRYRSYFLNTVKELPSEENAQGEGHPLNEGKSLISGTVNTRSKESVEITGQEPVAVHEEAMPVGLFDGEILDLTSVPARKLNRFSVR
jgi:hypothetical protein